MFILSLIFPLAVTLVIETGVYMILKHRDLKLFLVVSMMNLILNPTMTAHPTGDDRPIDLVYKDVSDF